LTWRNGKYRKIDGIFCEVVRSLKSCLKVKVGLETKYVVELDGVYSHGATINEAKADLVYKIGSRDKSEYEGMTLETVLTKADAIKMYRVITGACQAGTKHFVESLEKTKRQYSVEEIIELTKDQYGNGSIVQFFKKEVSK
jgi:ribosomal protein L7/L12